MKKTTMIAAIAVSMVAGIFVSPNMAIAHPDLCAKPSSVNSEKSVWHALCDLQTQIQNIPRGFPDENIIINEIPDSDCQEPCLEWNPPKLKAIITDDNVKPNSFIAIMTQNSDGGDCTVFRGTFNDQTSKDNQFWVDCSDNRKDGSVLKYMIVNPSQ